MDRRRKAAKAAAKKGKSKSTQSQKSRPSSAATAGRRSVSQSTPAKGGIKSKGSKARGPATPQPRRKSSTAAATPAKVVEVKVLKRPARVEEPVAQVCKRPAMNDIGQVMKRPAKASSADEGPRPGLLTLEALAAHNEAHPSAANKVRDMDVESIVTMELTKRERRSVVSGPASRCAPMSPTAPASFADPFSFEGLGGQRGSQLKKQAQSRPHQAPPPPKSWGKPSNVAEQRASAQKTSSASVPRSSGRHSIGSTASMGESLDALLPSGDQLRLRANVPKECYDRALKRRASATRDLRARVSDPDSPPPRPPASPSRNSAQEAAAAVRSRAAPCSPAASRRPSWAPPPTQAAPAMDSNCPGTPGGATAARAGEAMEVASRILAVRKQRFASQTEWGFAVLDRPLRDVHSVQKAYRVLMRPLHPDKAGNDQAEVVAAVDILREAKDLCERALRQQHPPDRPTRLSFTHLCTKPSLRKFKVTWKAPESRPSAPVHRYVVAVFDPSYGKVLSIGTLEPDYSQEFKRYLRHDDPELCSYTISEQDLRKMPNLFKYDTITVQVAAGNNEGQSDWSIIRVGLQKAGAQAAAEPPAGRPVRLSVQPPSTARSSGPRKSIGGDGGFDRYIDKKNGKELESWLQHQKKEDMQFWLKKRLQQCSGSKEMVIQRIISMKEGNPW